MPVRFDYLYCDADNWKVWGSIVFGGGVSDELIERLRASLDGGEFFIADQVRVPELFPESWPCGAADHCFHAFHSVAVTDDRVDDALGRSFVDLLAEFQRAESAGWQVFDPVDRMRTRSP